MPYASCTAASKALATTSVQSFGIGTGSDSAADDRRRGAQVLRLEGAEDIDRVAAFVAGGRDLPQIVRQRAHGADAGLVRHGRKRPGVAERHRSESPGFASAGGADPAVDVQQRDAIDRAAAELIGRAIAELLVPVIDLDDAGVGRPGASVPRALDGNTPRATQRVRRRAPPAQPGARAGSGTERRGRGRPGRERFLRVLTQFLHVLERHPRLFVHVPDAGDLVAAPAPDGSTPSSCGR